MGNAMWIVATPRKTGERKPIRVRVTETGVDAALERLARKAGGTAWHRDYGTVSDTRFLAQPMTWVPSANAWSLGPTYIIDLPLARDWA